MEWVCLRVGTHQPLLLTPSGIHHMYGRQAKLWEGNVFRSVCPWGVGCCEMGFHEGGAMKEPPPPFLVNGTHPTGMLSCNT